MIFLKINQSKISGLNNTGQQKNIFFKNSVELYTYFGAEWCPKHDVTFSFPLN